MNGIRDTFETLFTSHGWGVARQADSLTSQFILIAENDLAIVFVAASSSDRILSDARQLSAAVATLLQDAPGDKTWEAYLLLALPSIEVTDQDSVVRVQRDLTFCRKVVLDLSRVTASSDPLGAMEDQVSFLFPLPITEGGIAPEARDLLKVQLVQRGTNEEAVEGLLDGIEDPNFDPTEFLSSLSGPQQ
jgi:hypothetical protein